MRQTNAGIRRGNTMNVRAMFCMLLLLFGSITAVMADISGVTLTANTGTTGNTINQGGSVSLSASWTGDSPPYTAKFKKGSNTIVSDSALTSTSSAVSITAAQIGDTGGTAEKLTVEIIDSIGKTGTAVADKGVIVDFISPTLTAQITNGSVFSNSQSVRIQITSNEVIKSPSVSSNGVVAVMEGSLTTGNSFVYNLQLTSAFTNGVYNVSISAKDVSEPAASANTGNTSVSFTVGTTASGDTAINSSSPASPTNATTVTLSGTCPSGTTNVEMQDSGTSVSAVSVTGTSWSVGLSPAEGTHSYVAISKDSLGSEISRSAAFSLIVDRAAPAVATVETAGIPTNTNQSSISIPVNVTGIDTEVSKPLKIQVYNNGAAAGAPQTVNASPQTVSVTLQDGNNSITFQIIDAAGNTSGQSTPVNISKNTSSTSTDTTITLDAPIVMPLPVANSYQIGAGTYKLKIIFGKAMDQTTNPVIKVTTAGGANISSSTGTWNSATTYIGEFSIPKNGGAAYSGGSTLSVSGAKDTYGNTLETYTVPGTAFYIDSTPAVATFNETGTIYVSSSTTSIALSGQVSDSGSGVGYVDLIWQPFSGGAVSSQSVPIMTTSPSPWSYAWNPSALSAGQYKLWVAAADQAKPFPNVEEYLTKAYRIVIVDRDVPSVTRVSLGNSTTDINNMGSPVTAGPISRLTVVLNDGGDSGIDFTSSAFVFTLVHDSTSTNILGNYSNNGNNTVYFDFPELSNNGSYTVTVVPVDKGGNKGVTVTRSFRLDTEGPDTVVCQPGDQTIANETHVALSQKQVWATINHAYADYTNSKITVKYNGATSGGQLSGASTTALVWQFSSLASDQSHDGRYDVTVTPKTTLGNSGNPVSTFFNYDTIGPVVTETSPAVTLSGTGSTPWFGTSVSQLSISFSDAPKDIIQYASQMPAGSEFASVKTPGDSSWYNGNGSGLNLTNSSFTWTMGTQTSGAATTSGNKMLLTAPTAPDDTAAGVIDLQVSATGLDYANAGQVAPNATTVTYTYKFDYSAPSITKINQPTTTNNKYCKNILTIEGTAEDSGSSAEVKVSSIEWSENGSAWSTLTSDGLPAKSATFKSTLDISSRTDGTYTLQLRAIDLGNNRSSETSAVFVVDRTPPEAPTMVLPLPDIKTNKRSQLFKWSKPTDADNFLLQVADDPSFNNVLNHQVSTSHPGLIGQVLVMGEGAVSVPKDGTYYWRVASIETCADGYNLSEFSNTRKFVVDTVKPSVVSVLPSPSSSNKITTGMVTFTIRFSELIDTTIAPTVKITSAGGQMMIVEKVNYTEDTWTGTTVIPKNSSALYDGTAIIAIEGTTDLAGNLMAVDSTNSVVINTAPSFTTKIFSNPANEYEIMILTKTSEALQAPAVCSVQQSSNRTPVTMNFLKEKYYAGSYKIDITSPGKAYIDMSGTDLYGMSGYDSVEFTVADLSASQRLSITSASGKASLKAAENSAYTAAAIYMIDRENLESISGSASLKASLMSGAQSLKANVSKELVEVVPLEEIGPASLKLKKCLLYTADISDSKISVPAEKVHIYRQKTDGSWIFQGGTLQNGKISAELSGLGRLALMADMTAPSAGEVSPASLETLDNSLPEIKGSLIDSGSGLNKDTFKLFIDEKEVSGAIVNDDGNFSYKVRQALPKGKHEISFEVADQAGNVLKKSFTITAPGAFALDEFMPYPNPATGNAMYFNYNFNQNAERVRLKIYDTAGHVVTSFDTFDFGNAKDGRIRWDLHNNQGKRVANGAYFYQLQVTRGGQTLKKRGKFAVMR